MGTVDRVLPWRRHHEASTADELTPLLARYRRRHPKAPVAMINRAYEVAAEAHRNQLRSQRRELHQPPAGRGPHRGRHRPRRDLGRRRAAARRRRGHRDHARRRRARLRRRGRRDRRRRHQARAHPVRLQGGPAGRHDAQDAGGDGPRPAGARSSSSPTGCTTCARSPAMPHEQAAAHRPGDARHLRPAGPPPRHAGAEAAARGPLASPRCTRSASPSSTTWSAPARPSARSTSPRRSPRCAAGWTSSASRPRSPVAASTCGASTRRWSVKGREFDDIFDLVADPRHRRLDEGLLRRARLHPRSLAAGGGAVQGLHRDAQVQPLPELAHHGDRARAASRSRCRSAPARCTSGPSGASPPTGRTRTTSPSQRHRLAQPHHRLAGRRQRPGAVHGEPEDRPRAGRGLRLHAQGPGRSRCRSGRPRSTSPTPCTPRSATPASAPRSTAGWCRSTTRCAAATRARSSRRRSRPPGRRRTGWRSSSRRGPATRSASGSAASGAST